MKKLAITQLKKIKKKEVPGRNHAILNCPEFWDIVNRGVTEAERKAFGAGRYQIRKYKTIEDYQKLNGTKI